MKRLRKTLYSVLCLMIGVCTLTGCIEEFEADLPSEDSNLMVVEGTICSGKLNKFTLSRTQSLSNGYLYGYGYNPPQMVYGAQVSVRGSDGSVYVAQPEDGYYSCQVGTLNPDVDYFLHIEVDGEVFESTPQKPLRTEKITDVSGVQNTPVSDIDVLVTPDAPFNPNKVNYYSWTYDETWEVHPDYTTDIYYDTEIMGPMTKYNQFPKRGWIDATGSTIMAGASNNYDGQHIQKLKLYDIPSSDFRVYHRYSGLIHQRAITKAEYEYELARRQASTEMGGLFTPLPSALPTNIHCLTSKKHVIGFIGCSLNISDYRFFLDPQDFTIHYPRRGDERVWLVNPSTEDCLRMVEKEGRYLCEWIPSLFSDDNKLHTAWASLSQLDVIYKYRSQGAYAEEPDFWSLNENVSY